MAGFVPHDVVMWLAVVLMITSSAVDADKRDLMDLKKRFAFYDGGRSVAFYDGETNRFYIQDKDDLQKRSAVDEGETFDKRGLTDELKKRFAFYDGEKRFAFYDGETNRFYIQDKSGPKDDLQKRSAVDEGETFDKRGLTDELKKRFAFYDGEKRFAFYDGNTNRFYIQDKSGPKEEIERRSAFDDGATNRFYIQEADKRGLTDDLKKRFAFYDGEKRFAFYDGDTNRFYIQDRQSPKDDLEKRSALDDGETNRFYRNKFYIQNSDKRGLKDMKKRFAFYDGAKRFAFYDGNNNRFYIQDKRDLKDDLEKRSALDDGETNQDSEKRGLKDALKKRYAFYDGNINRFYFYKRGLNDDQKKRATVDASKTI